MPPHPDETLPRLDYSLQRFVDTGVDLLNRAVDGNTHLFVSYMLSGRHFVNQDQHRMYLSALRGLTPPRVGNITISRDYDSLIGISKDLPYTKSIAVHTLPNFTRDTLSVDNHLTYPIRGANQQDIAIALHRIPNIGFATVGHRSLIRLFFPSLYQHGRVQAIQPATIARIYLNAIKPSVLELQPEREIYWPASYDNLLNLARGLGGRLHFQTIDVPAHILDALAELILRRLESDCQLPGAFFLHECRGTKGQAPHDPEDEAQRGLALDTVLADFRHDVISRADFWIDVGTEVHDPGMVVHWTEEGHSELLAFALGLDPLEARPMTQVESRFHIDNCAQLDDLAGFRFSTTQNTRSQVGVAYVQAYCTEKAVIYQLHKGAFRRHTASDLFPDELKQLLKDVDVLSKTFNHCSGYENAGDAPQAANARLEVRVKLSECIDTLAQFEATLIRSTMVSIPAFVWWYFKFLRATALHLVLSAHQQAPLFSRKSTPSLLLGAVTVYMLNALISRPYTGREHIALVELCAFHTRRVVRDEEPRWVTTAYSRGMYFLCSIVFDSLEWRIPASRRPDHKELAFVYMEKSLQLVEERFYSSGLILSKSTKRPPRVPNRTRLTKDADEVYGDDADIGPTFGLDDTGMTMPKSTFHRQGPDIDEFEEEDEEEEQTVDQFLRKIWRQFPLDLIAKAPNKKDGNEDSYLIADQHRHDSWTTEDFTSLDLRGVFHQVHARRLTKEDWRKYQFHRYFPLNARPQRPGQNQNFPYMRYMIRWVKFMNAISPGERHVVQRAVEKEFNKLKWVPHSTSDRCWTTKAPQHAQHQWISWPSGTEHHKGVSIALNPRTVRKRYHIDVGREVSVQVDEE